MMTVNRGGASYMGLRSSSPSSFCCSPSRIFV